MSLNKENARSAYPDPSVPSIREVFMRIVDESRLLLDMLKFQASIRGKILEVLNC